METSYSRWAFKTTAAAYTLQPEDYRHVAVELTGSTGRNFTVPPPLSIDQGGGAYGYPLGTEIMFRQVGSGAITFVAGTGVTIAVPTDSDGTGGAGTLVSRGAGSTLKLILRAQDLSANTSTWWLTGETVGAS